MSEQVETQTLKLESWMQFVLVIISIGIQLYYQKEKFKDTSKELDLLKQFSQTVTQGKIEKLMKQLGTNVPVEVDRAALGSSLQQDLKILQLVKCRSTQNHQKTSNHDQSSEKKID